MSRVVINDFSDLLSKTEDGYYKFDIDPTTTTGVRAQCNIELDRRRKANKVIKSSQTARVLASPDRIKPLVDEADEDESEDLLSDPEIRSSFFVLPVSAHTGDWGDKQTYVDDNGDVQRMPGAQRYPAAYPNVARYSARAVSDASDDFEEAVWPSEYCAPGYKRSADMVPPSKVRQFVVPREDASAPQAHYSGLPDPEDFPREFRKEDLDEQFEDVRSEVCEEGLVMDDEGGGLDYNAEVSSWEQPDDSPEEEFIIGSHGPMYGRRRGKVRMQKMNDSDVAALMHLKASVNRPSELHHVPIVASQGFTLSGATPVNCCSQRTINLSDPTLMTNGASMSLWKECFVDYLVTAFKVTVKVCNQDQEAVLVGLRTSYVPDNDSRANEIMVPCRLPQRLVAPGAVEVLYYNRTMEEVRGACQLPTGRASGSTDGLRRPDDCLFMFVGYSSLGSMSTLGVKVLANVTFMVSFQGPRHLVELCPVEEGGDEDMDDQSRSADSDGLDPGD